MPRIPSFAIPSTTRTAPLQQTFRRYYSTMPSAAPPPPAAAHKFGWAISDKIIPEVSKGLDVWSVFSPGEFPPPSLLPNYAPMQLPQRRATSLPTRSTSVRGS